MAGIAARQPALIFGGLALAIVVAGGVFDRVQHRELLEEAERKVDAIARLEARSIREWRWSLQRAAGAAARAWGPLAGGPDHGRLLRDSVAGYRDQALFTDVAVLGPGGEAEAAAGEWAGGVPRVPSDQPLRRVWLSGIAPIAGRDVLHVFAPMGGGRVAVFRADVEAGVEPILATWPSSSVGSSRLVRQDGAVLFAPDAAAALEGPVLRAWSGIEGSDWAVVAELSRAEPEETGWGRRPVLALLVVALVAAAGLAVQARARRERLRFLERSWRAERQERLLREEQARLVEAVDDPVVLLGDDGRVRFWNAAAARVFEHAAKDAVGRRVVELLGAELLDDDALSDLRAGRPARADLVHRRRDGSALQVEVTGVALRDADGGLTGVLAVCRDRTQQLHDEASRRAMEAQLVEADRMASMGLVAASVAHEMATPLTYLLASLRYAKDELERAVPSLDDVRSALAEAEEGGERLRRILGEVRTFSRRGGDGDGPAEVARVVESALRLVAAELRQRARAAIDVPPVLRVRLGADRLGQVLLNLIMNAAQAIPAGEPDRNAVRVSARRDGDEVVLEVSDTGGGIPPEVAARIFEPFYTTKPRGVGTGLGLSICRRLVGEAGGSLTFETAPGAGTVFRVRLPAAQPAPPVPARARLLLVSAEVRGARALAHGLEAELDVHLETDPRRAVARLAGGEPFEIVLCEAALPGMDGAAILDQVALAHPALRERFVFLAGPGAGLERLRAAGHLVLERPLEPSVVLRLVLGRLGAVRQVA